MANESKTLYCGNLSEAVTEELLYELFLQAGPLLEVKIPKDKQGKSRGFGFVTFKHETSVPYAVELMGGESLFGRILRLQTRGNNPESPVANDAMNLLMLRFNCQQNSPMKQFNGQQNSPVDYNNRYQNSPTVHSHEQPRLQNSPREFPYDSRSSRGSPNHSGGNIHNGLNQRFDERNSGMRSPPFSPFKGPQSPRLQNFSPQQMNLMLQSHMNRDMQQRMGHLPGNIHELAMLKMHQVHQKFGNVVQQWVQYNR